MVGGSPSALQKVQQRVIQAVGINYFNSADHDTTLINVAANLGICLAPGFLNDHNPDYAWTPSIAKKQFHACCAPIRTIIARSYRRL